MAEGVLMGGGGGRTKAKAAGRSAAATPVACWRISHAAEPQCRWRCLQGKRPSLPRGTTRVELHSPRLAPPCAAPGIYTPSCPRPIMGDRSSSYIRVTTPTYSTSPLREGASARERNLAGKLWESFPLSPGSDRERPALGPTSHTAVPAW